jgi:hypothetical protein
MNTVVIIGAGCSKGLAGLPIDTEFMIKLDNKICEKYFLKEGLDCLFPRNLWKNERLEVCWNEIDDNFNKPKIILYSRKIDEWTAKFFELAESESSIYKYYYHYYYKMPLSLSPYQYVFMFAGWEMRKIVAEVYSVTINPEGQKNFELLIKKIKKLCDGSSPTFISFNYDTLLEQSLMITNYLALNTSKSGVYNILKPHGSVNWLHNVGQSISEWSDKSLPLDEIGFLDGILRQHSIVGLVSNKLEFDFQVQKSLGSEEVSCLYGKKMISVLKDCIKNAEQLIVIGYSFPFTDGHIRKAFMEAHSVSLKRVFLITKNNKEAKRIARIFNELFAVEDSNIKCYTEGVEHWVNEE